MKKSKRARSAVARKKALAALREEPMLALDAMIASLLSLPMEKRVHFLRKRLPFSGSSL